MFVKWLKRFISISDTLSNRSVKGFSLVSFLYFEPQTTVILPKWNIKVYPQWIDSCKLIYQCRCQWFTLRFNFMGLSHICSTCLVSIDKQSLQERGLKLRWVHIKKYAYTTRICKYFMLLNMYQYIKILALSHALVNFTLSKCNGLRWSMDINVMKYFNYWYWFLARTCLWK